MPSYIDDSVINRLDAILSELNSEKRASEMDTSGEAAKDPGGYCGPTKHPIKDAPTNLHSAPLGPRAKENERDMKAQGVANVDETSTDSGGSQDDKQLNIGTHQSAVGEDPAVEHDFGYKVDDPGTTSPLNAEELGEKYSSVKFSYEELSKMASDRLNAVLVDLHDHFNNNQNKSAQARTQPATQSAAQPGNFTGAGKIGEAALAAQAGHELATAFLDQGGHDKLASVTSLIEQTMREAEADADRVGQFFAAYFDAQQGQTKAANPMAAMMPPGAGPGGDPMGGGDPTGGGGLPPQIDPSGGGAPGGPDELPPGSEAGEGGEGGAPGQGEPDGDEMGGGGEGDHAEALNELYNALLELGIQPEQLLEAAQHAGGGKEALAKSAASLTPRMRKAAAALVNQPESAVRLGSVCDQVIGQRDRGGCKIKEATGHKRRERDEIKSYLLEMCGLGR